MDLPVILLIIGVTEALKRQFPSLSGFAPFIAIALGALAGHYNLEGLQNWLDGVLQAGAAMGIYTTAKTVGTLRVENT